MKREKVDEVINLVSAKPQFQQILVQLAMMAEKVVPTLYLRRLPSL